MCVASRWQTQEVVNAKLSPALVSNHFVTENTIIVQKFNVVSESQFQGDLQCQCHVIILVTWQITQGDSSRSRFEHVAEFWTVINRVAHSFCICFAVSVFHISLELSLILLGIPITNRRTESRDCWELEMNEFGDIFRLRVS